MMYIYIYIKKVYYEQYEPPYRGGGRRNAGGKQKAANGRIIPKCTGQSRGGQPAETARSGRAPAGGGEESQRTASSAEYEATCGPKGGEGKGYENPVQDHEECGGPKEMKWGGEGSYGWEGRERPITTYISFSDV